MGCFLVFPCFTTSKHRKLHKSVNPTTSSSSVDQGYQKNCDSVLITTPTEKSTNPGSLKTPIWESRDNSDARLNSDNGGKTVAIGLDAKTNTDISTEDVEILVLESKEDKEKNVKEGSVKLGVLVQLESAKERDNEKKKENGKLGVHVEIENDKERKEELEIEDEGFGVHVQIDNDKKIDSEENNENISLVVVHVELKNESNEEKEVKTEEDQSKDQSKSVSDSSVSSYISYPPMHRYHNCVINEDDEDQGLIQEDSSESLFSLSIDPRRQSKSPLPVEVDDKEVNSPLKTSSKHELSAKLIRNELDHNQSIDSLLNPIVNLAQWKTLKASPMATLDLHQEKENVYVEPEEIAVPISEEPISKVSDRKGKLKNDTAVTTSLSSWLVEPEKSTTVSKEESQYSTGNSYVFSDEVTSWKNFEDRPILGAWTIDEVRQISARSSPRKSPSHNPDETPIIGTVGSYWSHTGQNTNSSNSFTSPRGKSAKYRKNRENKALSCHSSPSRRRLERAFDKSVV